MASVVQFMHKKGFAHRDIKPHNFMLDNKFNIRIMDFGFLTDVKKESISKVSVGTRAFMAPEVIMN